ncbi:transposase family protein [Streptomyces griseus]|uniref:transposase family protein n=1 Tax=Streptomyces griseus TaxID=1911 RepID=UPI003F5EEA49
MIWASDVLPGATHDLTAARNHGIPAALAVDDIKCWADKTYQGASPAIRAPICGKHLRGWRRHHNRNHAKIRPRTRHLIKMEGSLCRPPVTVLRCDHSSQ